MIAFLLFTIAAVSMVATYLMTLYGAVGASAYMVVRQCALRYSLVGLFCLYSRSLLPL
jgi:hypothetical protein